MIDRLRWYGGGRFATPNQPVATRLTTQTARLYVLNPDITGRECKLDDARRLQEGWYVYILVNQDDTNTIDVVDHIGGAIFTLGAEQIAILGLLDNSTEAGEWCVSSQAATVSPVPDPEFISVFGGDVGTSQDTRGLYSLITDTWDGKDGGPDMEEGCTCRVASTDYIHGDAVAMNSFVFDTFTVLTDGGFDTRREPMVNLAGNPIAYHDGFDASNQVEEYNVAGDSWSGLNDFYLQESRFRWQGIDQGPVTKKAYLSGDVRFATAGKDAVEHTRGTDTYALITQPTTRNYEQSAWFAIETDRVYAVMGTDDPGAKVQLAQSYSIAGDAWTTQTQPPGKNQGCGGVKQPGAEQKANLGLGDWESRFAEGDNFELNEIAEVYTQRGDYVDPSGARANMSNLWNTIPSSP